MLIIKLVIYRGYKSTSSLLTVACKFTSTTVENKDWIPAYSPDKLLEKAENNGESARKIRMQSSGPWLKLQVRYLKNENLRLILLIDIDKVLSGVTTNNSPP